MNTSKCNLFIDSWWMLDASETRFQLSVLELFWISLSRVTLQSESDFLSQGFFFADLFWLNRRRERELDWLVGFRWERADLKANVRHSLPSLCSCAWECVWASIRPWQSQGWFQNAKVQLRLSAGTFLTIHLPCFFVSLSFTHFISLTDSVPRSTWKCSWMQVCRPNRRSPPSKSQTMLSSSLVRAHTHTPSWPFCHLSCVFVLKNVIKNVVCRHSSLCCTFPSRPVCGRHCQNVSSDLTLCPSHCCSLSLA